MKVTKKAINKALPNIRYFDRWYVPHGFAGLMPENASTLSSVIFRVDEDGALIERDYGVGDAYEREDYYMDGCCVEASSVITEWMDGEISRKDVVDEVQRLFAKWEEKEKYFSELENL